MTKPWNLDGAWAGETVAVLGNSPDLAADLKQLPAGCKVIAASRAIQHYPDADMLVVIDGNIPADFAGIVANGVPGAGLFVGISYERTEIAPGHVIEFRNTGLLAIRVAARLGASKILLAGFDPGRYEERHRLGFAAGTSACTADGVAQAFERLLADLRAQRITVEIIEGESAPPPALEWSPDSAVLVGDQLLPVPKPTTTLGKVFGRK